MGARWPERPQRSKSEGQTHAKQLRYPSSIWVWVKIKPPKNHRFYSLVPFTRVPFWVPVFDPQPFWSRRAKQYKPKSHQVSDTHLPGIGPTWSGPSVRKPTPIFPGAFGGFPEDSDPWNEWTWKVPLEHPALPPFGRPPGFHLLIFSSPVLALKGIDHYWDIFSHFSPGA